MEKFNRKRKIVGILLTIVAIGVLIVACTKKANEDKLKTSEVQSEIKDKDKEIADIQNKKHELEEKMKNAISQEEKEKIEKEIKEQESKLKDIKKDSEAKKTIDKTTKVEEKETLSDKQTNRPSSSKTASDKSKNAANKASNNKQSTTSSGNSTSSKASTSNSNTSISSNTGSGKNPVITTKTITETNDINFNVVDNLAYTGAKSRTYQNGVQGKEKVTTKITYSDGVEINREIVSREIVTNPQDKIIERYVKVRDRKTQTVMVENPDDPIVEYITKPRWFVKNQETGEVKIFYSYDDMMREVESSTYLHNWGDYEDEVTEKIVGYYKTLEKEVVVQEEAWEWQH